MINFMGIEKIIAENLALMNSSKEGGMERLGITESFGGNAGKYQGNPCIVANFYFDAESGKIQIFGNMQDLPTSITSAFPDGSYRQTLGNQIVGLGIPRNTAEQAKQNLLNSAQRYNSQKGFINPIEVVERNFPF